MNEPSPITLLPAGLHDVLPPHAAHEAAVVELLMAVFGAHGYDRVKPPLVEFETSLLSGAGAATADQIFRLMDPVSHRMMGVRGDITLQVARIAASRLGRAPRPLRLSYAGQVLRVKGSHLRSERQFTQAGVELIGSLEPAADAEIILLAAEALTGLQVARLSIDLTVPTLVPTVCAALGLSPEEQRQVREAVDHRDATAIAAMGGRVAELIGGLLDALGPAPRALARLAALDLPGAAAVAERDRLTRVVALVTAAMPDLPLTIDPVEHRGFEYQTGVSFTFFAHAVRGELGRGGRYRAGFGDGPGEPATGFTLYLDTLMHAVAGLMPSPRRVLVPQDTPLALAAQLRRDHWVTINALGALADPAAEARRLGCSHVVIDGQPQSVD